MAIVNEDQHPVIRHLENEKSKENRYGDVMGYLQTHANDGLITPRKRLKAINEIIGAVIDFENKQEKKRVIKIELGDQDDVVIFSNDEMSAWEATTIASSFIYAASLLNNSTTDVILDNLGAFINSMKFVKETQVNERNDEPSQEE